MGLKFNPFTGNFDFTGSGGGGGGSAFFAGEVATYADLPLDGTAALDSRWLVRSNSGTWPFSSYKQAGVYVRKATVGASRDNDYQLTDTSFFDVMSDNAFLVYDDADATKNLKFQLSGITTGTTRTLTVPDASGTIARTETFAAPPAIGNTTAAAANFTTVGATGIITGAATTASPPTTTTEARGLQFASLGGNFGSTAAVYGSHPGTASLGIGIANSSAGSITQVASFTSTGLNSCAIGSTTAAAGSFTTLSSNTGTITASTPLAVTQTWNDSATFFRAIQTNITNTQSQTESYHLLCIVGGSPAAYIRRDGRIVGAANVYGSINLESALLPQGVAVGNASYIGFCSNSFANDSGGDLRLFRDAANTLAQRNGTNAQEFRIYNTFTSSTNYQRLTIKTKAVTLSALTGASVATTGGFIPDGAVLVGLTTRVSTAITGATGYDIGDGTDADRWGANIGIALNTSSDNTNWTAGTIQCFTAAQEVTLTAVGSNFTGGAVVIVAHYLAGEAD
jgi:hypothetical protein